MLFLVLLNIWIYWAWLSFILFIIGAQHRRNLRERRALWMVSLWSQGWKRQVDFYYQSLNYIINCACFSFVIKNTNTWFVFFSPHLDFPDWEVMFSSVKSLGDDLAFLKTLYTLVCTVAKALLSGNIQDTEDKSKEEKKIEYPRFPSDFTAYCWVSKADDSWMLSSKIIGKALKSRNELIAVIYDDRMLIYLVIITNRVTNVSVHFSL